MRGVSTEAGVTIGLLNGNTIDGWGSGIQLRSYPQCFACSTGYCGCAPACIVCPSPPEASPADEEFLDDTAAGGMRVRVDHNLVTNASLYGIDYTGTLPGPFECNDVWSPPTLITSSNFYKRSGSSGTPSGNSSGTSHFCSEGDSTCAEPYALRIDSFASPGNSGGCGQIGIKGVACAWDTLERSTMVPAQSVVTVFEDVYVPVDSTLTIESGAQILFDASDESEAGVDTARNEIRVRGTLEVNGAPGSMVEFKSSETTHYLDAWFGIWSGSSGTVDLTGAAIGDARYGVYRASGSLADVTVDSCDFGNCETAFVWASLLSSGDYNDLTVKNSTFSLGNIPYGMWLEGLDRVRVEGNTFTGGTESETAYAIYVNAATLSAAFQASVTGNFVTQVRAGSGITIGGQTPTVSGNTITLSKWGTQFLYDSAPVDSSNTISICTTGMYSSGSAAPFVTGVGVVDCATGIYADETSKGTYTDVTISGAATSTGIKAWSRKVPGGGAPGPVFRSCQIIDFTSNGVLVDSTGFINLGVDSLDMGVNRIHSDAISTPKYIQTITPRKVWPAGVGVIDIKAVYNWYGEYPPDSTRFGPHVIYLPALTEAPAKPGVLPLSRTLVPPISNLLLHVSPNPFASRVDFEIGGVPAGDENTIEIFDVSGRSVRQFRSSGSGRVAWDGRDEVGRGVSSGLYWARLSYRGKVAVQKLVKTW